MIIFDIRFGPFDLLIEREARSVPFKAQLRDHKAEGYERIFEEQASSVDVRARERFEEALPFLREGDPPLW